MCVRCSLNLGSQVRQQDDVRRAKIGRVTRAVVWVAVLVAAAIAAPSIFRAGKGYYLQNQLRSVTREETMACGGPLEDTTPDYKRQQVEDCVRKNAKIAAAQQEYDAFMKG